MVATVIPARGGSKGLPGKNLRSFCGKPLLAWSILQALQPVYVTSDSDTILTVAKLYGAIPIKRPPELATDEATSESALLHALDFVGEHTEIIFMQATSPLRNPSDVHAALDQFERSEADSMFSASVVEDVCLWEEENGRLYGKTFDPVNRGQRQTRKPLYLENGSIYIFKPEILRKGNRLGGKVVPFLMQPWQQYEIDDEETFDLCRYQFIKHKLDT